MEEAEQLAGGAGVSRRPASPGSVHACGLPADKMNGCEGPDTP